MSELPQLDAPQAYVVVGPNDQRGPYTLDLLVGEVAAGRLSDATPVWWPGLADWTTMAGHPGVAAEIERRRAPEAAPGWSAAAQEPTVEPVPQARPAPQAQTFAPAGAPEPAAPLAEPDQAVTPEVATADPLEDDIDVAVVEATIVDLNDGHLEAFTAVVARSRSRATVQDRVDAVHEQVVAAVSAGVIAAGFSEDERTDESDHTEIRFDGADGDLVTVSVGRALARRVEDLRSDHLPLSVVYRSSVGGATAAEQTGEHGEVVISSDEWTGRSTSSVRLFLGLDHYLDDSATVRFDTLRDDVTATVSVLRARLG